jgi:hypothetical protein
VRLGKVCVLVVVMAMPPVVAAGSHVMAYSSDVLLPVKVAWLALR